MQELLGRINANLTIYTGLVETARTNNRAGNPVGSSYLSEASSLMQETILPDAQRLYQETSSRVDAETTASTRIPAPVILVVATTIVFGAFAHRWLGRRTRRRVNIGLVAAAHGHRDHGDLGGHGAGDLDRGQPQRQGHLRGSRSRRSPTWRSPRSRPAPTRRCR